MSRSFPPPRSRPRSHTAKALEIVRLTKRPSRSSGGWPYGVRSLRSNAWPVNATPLSGEPTWERWMALGARSAAMGAEIPVAGVPEPSSGETAPVTSPGACGPVPHSPSKPPIGKPS